MVKRFWFLVSDVVETPHLSHFVRNPPLFKKRGIHSNTFCISYLVSTLFNFKKRGIIAFSFSIKIHDFCNLKNRYV